MLFTPAQMREFSTLSENTITNWRKAGINFLQNKKGSKPQYTITEILTLIVLNKLKYSHGGQLEIVIPFSPQVLDICKSVVHSALSESNIGSAGFLLIAGNKIEYHPLKIDIIKDNVAINIIISFAPLMRDLIAQIKAEANDQLILDLT